jgi:hypothetical protein
MGRCEHRAVRRHCLYGGSPGFVRYDWHFASSASASALSGLGFARTAGEDDRSCGAKSGELYRRITDDENRDGSGGRKSLIVLEATPGIEPG